MLFLIIQIFHLSLNAKMKELPIYSEIASINNEMIFLKTDLFKPEKNIHFYINGRVYDPNPYRYRQHHIYMKYCFVQQKEDSCRFIDVTKFTLIHYGIDGSYINYLFNTTIIMSNYNNYLLFSIEIEKAEKLKITHDPNSDVSAKEFSPSSSFNQGETLFVDAKEFVKYGKNKFIVALSFDSTKTFENLTIYYNNTHHKNKEFTENLGKNVVTDYYKKKDNFTEFYFSLPVFNYSKEIIEYRYLIFKPENGTGIFKVRELRYDVRGVPKYGALAIEEKTNKDVFYLNIEDIEEGDDIYLQFITSSFDYDYYIYYNFSDTNYEEDFHLTKYSDKSKNSYSKDDEKEYIFYFSITKKEKAKYLLFGADGYYADKFTVKNTKKNEYVNYTLIIIVVSCSIVIVAAIALGVSFYIKKGNKANTVYQESINEQNYNTPSDYKEQPINSSDVYYKC